MQTPLSSAAKTVIIGGGQPTVIIGERINPAGKKRLAAALQAGDLTLVREEAIAQVEAGPDVIDVNVGALGVDDVTLLPEVVRTVMGAVDAPVSMDSPNTAALKAALEVYQGSP